MYDHDGGTLLLSILLVLFIGLPVAAVLLRVSCRLLEVTPPEFRRAIVIVFALAIVSGLINLILVLTLGKEEGASLVINALSVVINMFVAGLLYSKTIPDVDFMRGVRLYWTQVIMLIVIGLVLLVPIMLIRGAI